MKTRKRENGKALEQFLSIQAMRLEVPESLLDEFIENNAEEIVYEIYQNCLGYRFPWGDILEEREEFIEDHEQKKFVSSISWEFVMADILKEYQKEGGNLEELSDIVLLGIDSNPKIQKLLEKAPEGFLIDDGNEASSFSIWTTGDYEFLVRKWIAEVFLPEIIPLLIREAKIGHA